MINNMIGTLSSSIPLFQFSGSSFLSVSSYFSIFFHCPKMFAQIIRECLHDDPGRRPTSLQLLEKLEAVIQSYTPPVAPTVIVTTGSTSPSATSSVIHLTSSPSSIPSTVTTRAAAHSIKTSPSTSSVHPTVLVNNGSTIHSYPDHIYKVTPKGIPSPFPLPPPSLLLTHIPLHIAHHLISGHRSWEVTALAGSKIGSADGTADECSFNLPFGLVFSAVKGIY